MKASAIPPPYIITDVMSFSGSLSVCMCVSWNKKNRKFDNSTDNVKSWLH